MLRSLIADALVPVTVEHGPVKIVLQARLEAVSLRNSEYKELLQAEHEARIDALNAQGALDALLSTNTMLERIYGEVKVTNKGGKARQPNQKEIDERTEAWREEIKTASEGKEAKDIALVKARCARVLYLVKEWDITEVVNGVEQMFAVTVENLLGFSATLINKIIDAVEGAVLGPLPQTGSSED